MARPPSGGDGDKSKRLKMNFFDDSAACVVLFEELGISQEYLRSGKVTASSLDHTDMEFVMIKKYITSGLGAQEDIQLLNVIGLEFNSTTESSTDSPTEAEKTLNPCGQHKTLLWHGSGQLNIGKILQDGYHLPEDNGQDFGPGLYFTDSFRYSLLYCATRTRFHQKYAYLVLSEVTLGESYTLRESKPDIKSPIVVQGKVYDSLAVIGMYTPEEKSQENFQQCTWPIGLLTRRQEGQGPFYRDHNEFVVFSPQQVKPKYLIKVQVSARSPIVSDKTTTKV